MFGATRRNGGFCCLGGSKASVAYLDQKFGKPERLLYRKAEAEAVALVSRLLKTNQIDADRHSDGETLMAHRPKDVEAMMNEKNTIRENYGVDPVFYPKEELLQHGFGGQFHAAMTTPIGFALNPRKYADGLLDAAMGYGFKVYGHSPVIKIEKNLVASDSQPRRHRSMPQQLSLQQMDILAKTYQTGCEPITCQFNPLSLSLDPYRKMN